MFCGRLSFIERSMLICAIINIQRVNWCNNFYSLTMQNKTDKYHTAKYKMPKYKGRRYSTGNADEKILAFIDRDIITSLLLTFGGLLFSYDGRRGFPFPWTDGEQANISAFLISFAVITTVVIIADLITAAVRRSSEPSAEQKYAAYTRNQTFSVYPSDDMVTSYEISSGNAGTVREASSTARSTSSSRSYEKKMSDDYEKLKSTVLKPMLNGQKPTAGRIPGQRKPAGVVAAIIIMCFAISFICSIAAMLINDFSDNSPYIDDGPEYIADNGDYDEESALTSMSGGYIEELSIGNTGWISEIGDGDAEAIAALADADEMEWYPMFEGVSDNNAVVRYDVYLNDYDNEYVFAFRYSGDDPDSGDCELTGLMVCPIEKWEEGSDAVPEEALGVGDVTINDVSILFWYWD